MQPGYKYANNIRHVVASLGLCDIAYGCMPDAQSQLDAINAVTGWDATFDELFLTGERIANIRHLFCLREGVSVLDMKFPDRMAGRPPSEIGPQKGVTIDEERITNEFLQEMDWDLATSMPSANKLEELGLQGLVDEFGATGK